MSDNEIIYAKLKYDLLADDGSVLVVGGTDGTIQDVDQPPTTGRVNVLFPEGQSAWLRQENLIFRDGPIGLLRAILRYNSVVLTDARYTFPALRDPVIDSRPSYAGGSVDLVTDLGFILRIVSDANNDLRTSFVSEGDRP